MDPFSITLGAVALIGASRQVCILVRERCEAHSSAERDVRENIAKLEAMWLKIETQMQVMRSLWHELEPDLQICLQRLLTVLQTKLEHANNVLRTVLMDPKAIAAGNAKGGFSKVSAKMSEKAKKARYTFLKDDKLVKKLVEDFRDWANLFDPSWYLIARSTKSGFEEKLNITSTTVQVHLQNPASGSSAGQDSRAYPMQSLSQLRRAAKALDSPVPDAQTPFQNIAMADRKSIAQTQASVANVVVANKNVSCVIDWIRPSKAANAEDVLPSIKRLVKALENMDPLAFGLLRCVAVSDARTDRGTSIEEPAFELAFEIPSALHDYTPVGLRTLLLAKSCIPMYDRLSIARSIATSLQYLATTRFVHKNIRSSNILVFQPDATAKAARQESRGLHAFLVGFENFRLDGGATNRKGDKLLCHEVYRHPERQGVRPNRRHRLRDDIYSLGVVLLELGLSISLVDEEGTVRRRAHGDQSDSDDGDKMEGIKSEFVPLEEAIEFDQDAIKHDVFKHPSVSQDHLMALAQDRLPDYVGPTYASVVVACLSDEEWEFDGTKDDNEPGAQEGIETGVQYVESVLGPLQGISL